MLIMFSTYLLSLIMAGFLGMAAAFAVFYFWIRMVGNPHVVETVIGLVLALIVGIWVWLKAR
jgi:hypothetical protein